MYCLEKKLNFLHQTKTSLSARVITLFFVTPLVARLVKPLSDLAFIAYQQWRHDEKPRLWPFVVIKDPVALFARVVVLTPMSWPNSSNKILPSKLTPVFSAKCGVKY